MCSALVRIGCRFSLICIIIYAIIGPVEFEFDADKSSTNAAKHGIGFEEATALWDDSRLVILPSRYLAVGAVHGRHWTAIFTQRSGRTRPISIRRARKEEVQLYEPHR